MIKNLFVLLCAAAFLFPGCANEEYAQDRAARQAMLNSRQAQLATEAYIYGFPLVLSEVTKRRMTKPANSPAARMIGYYALPGSGFRHFIKPDRDIYYSFAWLDLSKEPVLIEIPGIKKLYYNFALADAWTNIFYGVSRPEEKNMKFIVSGPRWNGRRPEDIPVQFSRTNTALFILRVRFSDSLNISSEAEALHKKIKIMPLSMYGKQYVPPAAAASVPADFKGSLEETLNMKIEDFFNLLNETLALNPPFAQDAQIMDRMLDIGIAPGMRFETGMFAGEVLDEMAKIPANMRKFINASDLESGENGWAKYEAAAAGRGDDYYLRMRDSFESFDLKIDENLTYGIAGRDESGNVLDGAKRYRISFEKGSLPQKKTFWGLSLYDKSGFYETNTVKRTGIGYRNNLKTNPDGSTDIYVQQKSPGKDKESNWLPVNAGEFMLVFRSYSDDGRIANLPAVKRIK